MTATEERPVQILELFGGIGSPRCALRNLKIPTMGYTNNYDVLDAREFGLPQARERMFTISCLNGENLISQA